jgi:4-amino-4-deoxy-L-arabinose transferase-like glycosyltransferase
VRSSVVLLAAVGLTLRLAFALGYWVGQPLTRDEREYLSLARSLAAGRGFVYDAAVRSGPVDPFGRAPGYPLFLALVGGGRAVTSAAPASVQVAQSVVGALGVVIVGAYGWRLAGARAAYAAAFIAALYPPLVWTAARVFSEAVFWPVGLLVAWAFDRAADAGGGRSGRAAAVAGGLAGVAILVRPAMILFVPLALVWLLWRRRLTAAAILALGAALVVGAWTVRNYRHDGRFVLVASEGGVTFWTGNNPQARGEGDLAANPDLKTLQQALKDQHPQLSEEAMEPVYYRAALAWIAAHPADWLALEARKLFYLVVPIGPSYTVHSPRYVGASLVSYGLLLPAALIGFWRMGRRRRRAPGLWLLFGSAVAVGLVFFPQERFRISVIDPVLVICAGAAWTTGRDEASRS